MTSYRKTPVASPRIGLTETTYEQVRILLRSLGASPVELGDEKGLIEIFTGFNSPFFTGSPPRLLQMEQTITARTVPLWILEPYEIRDGVLDSYVRENRGRFAVPIAPDFLRPLVNLDRIAEIVGNLDGLLIAGGSDVNPLLYGEPLPVEGRTPALQPAISLELFHRTRDIVELAFIGEALRQKKPVLGLCRGAQILAVALGGKLVGDIPTRWPALGRRHSLAKDRDRAEGHDVLVRAGSGLARALRLDPTRAVAGMHRINVNSYHHQCVSAPFSGVEICAWDTEPVLENDSGLIEGFVAETPGFAMGVQWHPERPQPESDSLHSMFVHDPEKLFPNDRPHDRALFVSFLEQCDFSRRIP